MLERNRRVDFSSRAIKEFFECPRPNELLIMTPILYGIPNCDTVKKARAWLDGHSIAYGFHDYKKAGISADKLESWCGEAGWETVLNRAGTTFKKLPEAAKPHLDLAGAVALMREQPSMIKRPIVEYDGRLLLGFNEAGWRDVFKL